MQKGTGDLKVSGYQLPTTSYQLVLHRHRCRLYEAHSDWRSAGQRGGISAAGVDSRRAGACTDRPADGRAFGSAEDPSNNGAANGAAADLGRACSGGRLALAIDGFSVERQPRTVGKDHRREADPKARPSTHATALLDERYLTMCSRTRRNCDAVIHSNIARNTRNHLILNAGILTAQRGFHLQADDRFSRNDQLHELRRRRFGCLGRLLNRRPHRRGRRVCRCLYAPGRAALGIRSRSCGGDGRNRWFPRDGWPRRTGRHGCTTNRRPFDNGWRRWRWNLSLYHRRERLLGGWLR